MKSIGITAILAGTLLASSAAMATTTYYSGQFCGPYGSGVWGTEHGAFITQYSALNCPAYWSTNSTNGQSNASISITAATVIVEKTASSDAPLCWVNQLRWDGTLFASGTLYACSTWGGCSSTDSSTGIKQLNWTNPISSGASLYTISASISCYPVTGQTSVYQYNFSTQ